MYIKIQNLVFRSLQVRLRWIVSLLTLFSVLLWSCEDGSDSGGGSGGSARSTWGSFLKISAIRRAHTVGSYAFQINDMVLQDAIIIKGGKADDAEATKAIKDLHVRWGFRHKENPDLIYWIQKHKSYPPPIKSTVYKKTVEDSEKARFVPIEFPEASGGEDHKNLEIIAEAASPARGMKALIAAVDLPVDFDMKKQFVGILASPVNFRATAQNGTVSKPAVVDLRWDAVTNAASYEVSYGKGSDATGAEVIAVFGKNSLTLEDALKPNTLYYFKVRANGKAGYRQSDYSSVANATTKKVALPAPTLQKKDGSSKVDSVYLTLRFDGFSVLDVLRFAGDYEISYGTNTDATGTTRKFASGNTSVTVDNLKANTQYYFKGRVLGGSNANNSAYSSVVAAKTLKPRMPAPQNIRIRQSLLRIGTTLQINWNAVPNANGYTVQVGVKNGSGYNWTETRDVPKSFDPNNTSFPYKVSSPDGNNRFQAGTTYYVEIVAKPSNAKFRESVGSIESVKIAR